MYGSSLPAANSREPPSMRAERAQVQPAAGRPGPAVERERDRPRRRVLAAVRRAVIGDVGDQEDLGLRLHAVRAAVGLRLLAQHGPARGGGVPQAAARPGQSVLGADEIVGQLRYRASLRRLVPLLSIPYLVACHEARVEVSLEAVISARNR